MTLAETIYHHAQRLPAIAAQEALDFVEFLEMRHRPSERLSLPDLGKENADWQEFEKAAGAWSGKFNRADCYER